MRLCRLPRQQLGAPWTPPVFLCPSLAAWSTTSANRQLPHRQVRERALKQPSQRRCLYVQSSKIPVKHNITAAPTASGLPLTCPGCGAYSQGQESGKAGYYDTSRKPVKSYLKHIRGKRDNEDASFSREEKGLDVRQEEEDRVYKESLQGLDPHLRESLGLTENTRNEDLIGEIGKTPVTPVCDRCNNLSNHNHGVPINHPTVESIRDVLAESPHRRNHIYHVVDAVDFPMSLIRGVYKLLDVATRSQNRRSRYGSELQAGKPTLSFIITRSDLLVPQAEQADRLLVRMREILAQALGERNLGRDFRGIRMGKMWMVSSMRGWWTKGLKEEIGSFKGGLWMLGKANVGKSKLIETVFPKQDLNDSKTRPSEALQSSGGIPLSSEPSTPESLFSLEDQTSLILPPAAPESTFPVMPTISHLPGTTAQPIRIRFGGGRGELIDLPGLDRQDMTSFVRADKQGMLVMRSRVKAEQQVIRPGQSLMVGDLVRITPRWPAWDSEISDTIFAPRLVMLAAAFVPFKTHITNTDKAVACQAEERSPSGMYEQLLAPGAGASIASAGTFNLTWDETRNRAGPLTRKDAAGLKPEQLPFVICSTDLAIEGIGWVELTVQIRRKTLDEFGVSRVSDLPPEVMPAVEVFTPEGKHVLARRPLNLFMMGGKMRKPVSRRSQRPRRSMKGAKRLEKERRRALTLA